MRITALANHENSTRSTASLAEVFGAGYFTGVFSHAVAGTVNVVAAGIAATIAAGIAIGALTYSPQLLSQSASIASALPNYSNDNSGGSCTNLFDSHAPAINNGFAVNLNNSRNYSSLIHQGNIKQLSLNFVHAKARLKERRGAPFISEQSLVFIEGNHITAINRHTGCEFWSYEISSGNGRHFRSASVLFSASSKTDNANSVPLILIGDSSAFIYAIDANRGKLVWKTFAGTDLALHQITGGLQSHKGKLYVPVSSKEVESTKYNRLPCCSSHGMLVKMDIESGRVDWRYHTTADATIKTAGRIGPSGAPIWTTPAIDPIRNAVYVGTGENYSEPATNTSDAIISIDLDTGEANWIFQATANDMWNVTCLDPGKPKCPTPGGQDFDFGASPIIIDAGRSIIAGDKGGTVFRLDADTGKETWRLKIGAGSTLGGIHWGMAVDQGHVYAAVTDLMVDKSSGDNALAENATPGIYAIDIATGKIRWQIHPTHLSQGGLVTPSLYSASLSVTNDILFAASLDGVVKAFSTHDGSELFHYNTNIAFTDVNGVAANGGTIDSVGVIVGRDGIVVNSGYNTFQQHSEYQRYQAGPGNTLLVFHLEQTTWLNRYRLAILFVILASALLAIVIWLVHKRQDKHP